MDTTARAESASVAPPKAGIIVHVLAGLWILGSGIAHEVQVAYRAAHGTLTHPEDAQALLAVGAGLIGAGALMIAAAWPLRRRADARWGFLAVAVLVAVLVGTYLRYGGRFLVGSTLVATVDFVVLMLVRRREATSP